MKVYLDTNAFFFFFFENSEYSKSIRKIFDKIKSGEYKAITSCFTLEELAYVTLLRLIERKYNRHPKDALRENMNAIAELLPEIEEMFIEIYSEENIEILPADKQDTWFMLEVMSEKHLPPRGSIHLKTMQDHGITHIVSTDSDFDRIGGITRIF